MSALGSRSAYSRCDHLRFFTSNKGFGLPPGRLKIGLIMFVLSRPSRLRRLIRSDRLAAAVIFVCFSIGFQHSQCRAGLVGGLTELINDPTSMTLTSQFWIKAQYDAAGGAFVGPKELDFVELDIVKTKFNLTPLTDDLANPLNFRAVAFDPVGPFVNWRDGMPYNQFGYNTTYPSRALLEGYGPVDALPFEMQDDVAFQFGTLTFDYSGLTINVGDTFTLDITGDLESSGLFTTDAVVSDPGLPFGTEAINFAFDAGLGPSIQTYTFGSSQKPVIPEPGSGVIFLGLACLSLVSRRRR